MRAPRKGGKESERTGFARAVTGGNGFAEFDWPTDTKNGGFGGETCAGQPHSFPAVTLLTSASVHLLCLPVIYLSLIYNASEGVQDCGVGVWWCRQECFNGAIRTRHLRREGMALCLYSPLSLLNCALCVDGWLWDGLLSVVQ